MTNKGTKKKKRFERINETSMSQGLAKITKKKEVENEKNINEKRNKQNKTKKTKKMSDIKEKESWFVEKMELFSNTPLITNVFTVYKRSLRQRAISFVVTELISGLQQKSWVR